MKLTRIAAVVTGAAVTVLAGGAMLPAQAAVPVTAVGWWTSSAVPPTVADGGIAVGNDPSGASVAALRLDLGGGASSATLKLVETANQVDKLASMQVCGAADTWAPANGGAAAQAPADTCKTGSVALAQQADGSWTADLHQLLAGEKGSASVIVMPAPGAAAFQIAFESPTVDGTTLDSSSSGSTGDASSTAAPATSSDTSTSPASSQGSSAVDTGSSSFSSAPSFSSSPLPAVPAPSVASEPAASTSAAPSSGATTSPAPASDTSASGTGRQFKANVGAGVASGHHATRGTALGLFALSLLIGAGAAGASWAKAQGLFELAGLRERFRFSR